MGRAQAPRQRHVLVTGNASTLIEWVGTVQRESGQRGVTTGESTPLTPSLRWDDALSPPKGSRP